MNTYIDSKGRTWHKFSISYRHELDEMTFSFDIWAIDYDDALERLAFIKENAKLDGKVI